ncbi:MAG TPA: metallophosphoesterase [Gemmatimonadales bacterium]|nr:metallophosphoesterase [Gemmatimonadales bacterium]
MERLVIVSDSHLGAVPDSVEEAFLAFLDQVEQLGDGLLVNGDLFDFWFSYRRVIPRSGVRVVSRLAELARRIPVAMTGGNHDRWGGSFWERELGIRFGSQELRLELGRRTVLAVHGDGVAEAHWRGRLIHRVTRHPLTSALFGLMHPDAGIWLVHRFSGHLADSTRDAAVLDAAAARQRTWAEQRLAAEPDVALLVMGHTHRTAQSEPRPGQRYLNPGAWLDGLRYAVATEQEVVLSRFPA